MPERKKKIPLLGQEVEVVEVEATKSSEFWNEYELSDGSVIKVKNVVTSITRMENQYNLDGTPIYLVATSPITIIVSSPPGLLQSKKS